MRYCPNCNSKLKSKNKFCSECGMSVAWAEDISANGKCKSGGVIVIVAVIVLLTLVMGVLFAFGDIDKSKGNADEGETTVPTVAFSDNPEAISAASQSVVKLDCYDKSGELYATGSGFACFADNVVVTNYHIIEKGVFKIEASTELGKTFSITHILAMDQQKDIAILATESAHNLTLLQPGNTDTLRKGEKVVAIGSPLGLLNSVSTGVFSGYVSEDTMEVLQFTASISSGSSGGALFNNNGEVLGITYASYEEGQNLNLAIPIAEVKRMYESVDAETTLIADWYWENNANKYHEYTYGVPVSVLIEELKENPDQYLYQIVSVEGYVSSVDIIGGTKRMGIYISRKEEITENARSDSKRYLNEPFAKQPYIDVATSKLMSDPYDIGISDSVQIEPGDHVIITGFFEKNASGFYHIEAGDVEFLP